MSNLNRYLYVVFPNVKFQTHQAIHILCTSTLQSGWFHYRHKEATIVLIKAVHRKNLVDKKHIKLIKRHQMYLPRSKRGNHIRYCHLYPIQGTLRIWLIIHYPYEWMIMSVILVILPKFWPTKEKHDKKRSCWAGHSSMERPARGCRAK